MTQETSSYSHAPEKPLVVLVVEDHEPYREVVCRALESYVPGVSMLGAATVLQAVSLLSQQAVNVLVADMTLPDGTALDLLREAQQHVSHGMKAILFSNYSPAEMEPLRQHPGVHAVLAKEQGLRELAKAVREAAAAGEGATNSQPPLIQAS